MYEDAGNEVEEKTFLFSRPCVFFLISALNLEEASTLTLHVRFRVGSDRR